MTADLLPGHVMEKRSKKLRFIGQKSQFDMFTANSYCWDISPQPELYVLSGPRWLPVLSNAVPKWQTGRSPGAALTDFAVTGSPLRNEKYKWMKHLSNKQTKNFPRKIRKIVENWLRDPSENICLQRSCCRRGKQAAGTFAEFKLVQNGKYAKHNLWNEAVSW